MTAWRLADSLVALRAECDAVAPHRHKYADGSIGNLEHSLRASRHNANAKGVVCALDITHDPAGGMDTYSLFDWLRLHPHPNLSYVISNRRYASRKSLWRIKGYTGSSPHDKHIHIAVGIGPDRAPVPPYDDKDSWRLVEWKAGAPVEEEADMTEAERTRLNHCRVSEVTQSYDIAIHAVRLGALMAALGLEDPPEVLTLELRKAKDVGAEKRKYGLS